MDLLSAAKAVRENAYAPYSKFKVGAALKTRSGAIFTGCNVENAAYPEGTCAEAGAVAAMAAAGERELVEVVVIADSPDPITPCGGCRQKLAEFGGADASVTMVSTRGPVLTMTLGDLLPGAFTSSQLDRQ